MENLSLCRDMGDSGAVEKAYSKVFPWNRAYATCAWPRGEKGFRGLDNPRYPLFRQPHGNRERRVTGWHNVVLAAGWFFAAAALSLLWGCALPPHVTRPDISALRDFADAYEPVSSEALICPSLPAAPPSVLAVLTEHPLDDEYGRNVSLVLLKLDRFHVEHFHQSYDLRHPNPDNPFLAAFARIARATDEWDLDRREYLGSAAVEDWVSLHGYEGRDERIARELRRIRAMRETISAELELGLALRALQELYGPPKYTRTLSDIVSTRLYHDFNGDGEAEIVLLLTDEGLGKLKVASVEDIHGLVTRGFVVLSRMHGRLWPVYYYYNEYRLSLSYKTVDNVTGFVKQGGRDGEQAVWGWQKEPGEMPWPSRWASRNRYWERDKEEYGPWHLLPPCTSVWGK